MFKDKKNLFNLSLLGIFVWLLVTSYSSSKRKPESVGELLNDFSWLSNWPKWLDLPLMPWINKWFKALNENFGFIFEAINNVLLAMLMGLKNFLFCYLIPGIILFGLGAIPAIISIFIYACPPLIRLTDLGIRLVDKEIIEAAESFGASKKQKLWGVQIPLALPNIMQGINQCTMMALAMVVIASMIGTRGLGDEVLLGLQQLNVGAALEAGLAIVLLAIVLDRMTQAYGEKIQERTQPQKKKN
jgi:ABC-type proline/glycine betaine transport system permease subunit